MLDRRHPPAGDALAMLLLLLLALAPRTLAPGDFITVDESLFWFQRSEAFLDALRQGDYAATNRTGHPGVTTMWLGALGQLLHAALSGAGWLDPGDDATYRMLLRLPASVVNALCVALAYPLLRRLLGLHVALLACVLWAIDPFLVAHARVLHVDALLTSFMALSLLAALVALRLDDATAGAGPVRWPFLAASAVAGGLAFLTKSPSALLLPVLGLAWALAVRRHRWAARPALAVLAAWGALAAAVWLLLWPAAWVNPLDAAGAVVAEVLDNGAVPHDTGNFFLGQRVADPGPLFYPVAVALRLAPWTMGGLLVLAALPRRAQQGPQEQRVLLVLLAFVLLVLLAFTLLPKKFDRYALPIFPVLAVLAAVGWARLAHLLRSRWGARLSERLARHLLPVAGVVVAAHLLVYHPYYLAYYNPLLGGGAVAARAIPVGWGEGMEQAGAFVARHTRGCERPVLAVYYELLENYVCNPVLNPVWATPDPATMDYAVLYINEVQRGTAPDLTARLRGRVAPLHEVQMHGINYAQVYPLAWATFGEGIDLRGTTLDTSAIRASGALTLTTRWQTRAPLSNDYLLRVAVTDPVGRVTLAEAPPGGPDAPTSTWQPGADVVAVHPLPLPGSVPAGTYTVTLALADAQAGAPLPSYSEAERVALEPFRLPLAPTFGGVLRLDTFEVDTSAAGVLRLYTRWRALSPLAADNLLFVHVLNEDGQRMAQVDVPPAGPATPGGAWQAGQTVDYTHTIPLAADLPPGRYRVALGVYDPRTLQRLTLRGGTPESSPDTLLLAPFVLDSNDTTEEGTGGNE